MSSFTFIRLLAQKNGINTFISRHYSVNCFKRNTEKLLINNSLFINNKNNGKEKVNQLLSIRRVISSNIETKSVDNNNNHNHSKIWSIERYLSIGLLAVIPVSFMTSLPAMDYLLSLSLITHIHWGIEAIVVDYIRPNVFGKIIPKLALGSVYLLSILSVGGLFYFSYTDVGLVQAIRMIANM